MRKRGVSVCALLSLAILFTPAVIAATRSDAAQGKTRNAENKRVSLSIGSIVSGVSSLTVSGRDSRQMGARGMLVSELAANYNCQVLVRSRGKSVADERSVKLLSRIDQFDTSPDQLPAADHAIAAYYYETTKGYAVTGRVFCIDLRAVGSERVLESGFMAPNVCEVAVPMAQAVARMLSLGPVPRRKGGDAGRALTWAVLPFRYVTYWDKEDTLAGAAEAALETFNEQINLVDRRALDAALMEHNVEWMDVRRGVSSIALARMVHADVLLAGQIGQGPRGLNVDLHLLDARTGAVLTAATTRNTSLAGLREAVVACTRRIVSAGVTLPTIALSTAGARRREADFLTSSRYYPAALMGSTDNAATVWESRVNACEGAYLLAKDDSQFVYDIMNGLADVLRELPLDFVASARWHIPTLRGGAHLIDHALAGFDHSGGTPAPLLVRADALALVGDLDRSASLVERHTIRHPRVQQSRVSFIKAYCMFRQGKLDEAEAVARDAVRVDGSYRLRLLLSEIRRGQRRREHVAAMQGGVKTEYQFLRSMFLSDDDSTPMGHAQYLNRSEQFSRFLRLAHEIESPRECMRIYRTLTQKRWLRRRTGLEMLPLTYHHAFCLSNLGSPLEAMRIASRVVSAVDGCRTYRYPAGELARSDSLRLIRKLESEHGATQDTWRTAENVRPMPDNMKIYLVPVGDVDGKVLASLADFLVGYYGKCIRIQQSTSMPKMSKTGERVYHTRRLRDQLLSESSIPSDAVFVLYLTDEGLDSVFSPLWRGYYNPYLLSYRHRWLGDSDRAIESLSRVLALYAIMSFRRAGEDTDPSGEQECANFPCAYAWQMGSPLNFLTTTMCTGCQVKYLATSFSDVQKRLFETVKTHGGQIISPDGAMYTEHRPKKMVDRAVINNDETTTFEIPHRPGLKTDGSIAEWLDDGFAVSRLPDDQGDYPDKQDITAGFRLAWDEEALHILVSITDDVSCEFGDIKNMWRMDSIELYLGSPGGSDRYQVILSPGVAESQKEPRYQPYDMRSDKSRPLRVDVARSKTSSGYHMEVSLPWSNLKTNVSNGSLFSFQILVNDSDKYWGHPDDWRRLMWFPRGTTYTDPNASYRIRLAPGDEGRQN